MTDPDAESTFSDPSTSGLSDDEKLSPYYGMCTASCTLCNGEGDEELYAEIYDDMQSFQPYSDLRSMAHENRRARTIRENNRGKCRSYTCRKGRQAERRTGNKKMKKQKLGDAVYESRNVLVCYKGTGCLEATKHRLVEWDVKLQEEMDAWVADLRYDIVRCTTLVNPVAVIGCPKLYTQVEASSDMIDYFKWLGTCNDLLERQSCPLLDWVDLAGRRILMLEEDVMEGSRIWTASPSVEEELDCTWDVISIASSEAWSVVDAEG
ncbi:hypothetical protein CC86DRAFT_405222 [Ophiobolus disseminans]|uniref:Uncharacterized protein n=1 Tax=Ophiobolus disseminans TaxID=1469910 RepID=A0A6A7A500_9PLEO|nr:hypothetical protein CC86DRAFT_405222 [Ophiobolus disseminans]